MRRFTPSLSAALPRNTPSLSELHWNITSNDAQWDFISPDDLSAPTELPVQLDHYYPPRSSVDRQHPLAPRDEEKPDIKNSERFDLEAQTHLIVAQTLSEGTRRLEIVQKGGDHDERSENSKVEILSRSVESRFQDDFPYEIHVDILEKREQDVGDTVHIPQDTMQPRQPEFAPYQHLASVRAFVEAWHIRLISVILRLYESPRDTLLHVSGTPSSSASIPSDTTLPLASTDSHPHSVGSWKHIGRPLVLICMAPVALVTAPILAAGLLLVLGIGEFLMGVRAIVEARRQGVLTGMGPSPSSPT